MKINHVMSNNVNSGIYEAIVGYFQRYSNECEIHVSEKPLENMDIYHYYRPHLENKLQENSVVTVHHDLNDSDSWLSIDKFIDRYKEAKKIICLNSNQEKILNDLGITQTVIIPHGYNSDIFNIEKKRNYQKKEKLTLGLISKRYGRKVKGEAYLYELIKHLDNTKFKFILVGEGRLEDASYLNQWGYEVDVYEYLPYPCFKDLYNKIDLLLMLSKFEGGPANIPEAIASKTPLISFNVGMVTDYLKDNLNGIMLSGNIKSDSEKINDISKKELIYKSMLKFSNDIPSNLYTWQEVIKQNIEVYRELVPVNDKLATIQENIFLDSESI